jgi:hypothetical protein
MKTKYINTKTYRCYEHNLTINFLRMIRGKFILIKCR